MADTDITKLTNSITDLVKTLQRQAGSSAQQKANDKEKKNIQDFYIETTKKAQENINKQKKADEESKNKFLKMAQAGMNMFKNVTIGTFNKVKNVFHSMADGVKKIFSEVKSHFLSLFGEESQWFGLLSAIKDSVINFGKSIWEFIKPKTPKWAKKMTKYLGDLYKLKVAELKADIRNTFGPKKGEKMSMGTILMGIVAGIGAAIGAFMHRYFFLIAKLPIFTRIMKLFEGIEAIPFLGKLVKGLKFGFKWLGWPLTLLLSVIDFIKGFNEEEGSLWEKIEAGLWSAFEGLIALPIQFITWAVEKILGWFGVDFDGKEVYEKIMGFIKTVFYMALDGWRMIFEQVGNFMSWISPIIKPYIEKLVGVLDPIITSIVNLFKTWWNTAIDFWRQKLPIGTGWMDKLKFDMAEKRPEPKRYSVAEAAREYERKKLEKQREQGLDVSKGMKDISAAQRESNKNSQTALNTINTMQNNQGGRTQGDVKQIQDEIDSGLIGINAYSGGID